MQINHNVSMINHDEIVKVNWNEIEKVQEFKFLGVIIENDNSFKAHIKKKKTICYSGIAETEKLGFNSNMPIQMKKLLYTALIRSKLAYGLETIKMNKKETKANLIKFENMIIKRALKISYYCKTTTLMYAMELTPINLCIIKRKIYFILQLLNYSATREIITAGCCATHGLSVNQSVETPKRIPKSLSAKRRDPLKEFLSA